MTYLQQVTKVLAKLEEFELLGSVGIVIGTENSDKQMQINVFYAAHTPSEQRAIADKLVQEFFGKEFSVETYKDIGHTSFTGVYEDLRVEVYVSAGYCTRVQTGTKMVEKPVISDATELVEEPVFEYVCNDPIFANR